MKLTSPQRRILSEGQLYGHYTKSGNSPIDFLVNIVADKFIDWNVHNPKFVAEFKRVYPKHATDPTSIVSLLKDELIRSNQNRGLKVDLIAKMDKQVTVLNEWPESVEIIDYLRKFGRFVLSKKGSNISSGLFRFDTDNHPNYPGGVQLTIGMQLNKATQNSMKVWSTDDPSTPFYSIKWDESAGEADRVISELTDEGI